MILQRGFAILDIVFGHDNPTYNPNSVQKWSLLIQFSGITTLHLSFQSKMEGELTNHGLAYE